MKILPIEKIVLIRRRLGASQREFWISQNIGSKLERQLIYKENIAIQVREYFRKYLLVGDLALTQGEEAFVIRKRLKLRTKDVAKELGYTQQYIGYMERDIYNPKKLLAYYKNSFTFKP